MGRPVGVTILAILCFLGAVLCILGGIGMMVGGGFMATLVNQAGSRGAGAGAGIFAALGAAAGIVVLILGALDLLVAWGLWKLKNWARIITMILMVLGVARSLFGVVGLLAHFSVVALALTLFWVVVYGLIIWYLLQPAVKAAFQGGQARAAGA